MITSTIYLGAAYGFVFIILLVLGGFYVWRNIALSQKVRAQKVRSQQLRQIVDPPASSPKPAKPAQSAKLTKRITILQLLPLLCFAAFALVLVFFLVTDGRQKDTSSSDIMIGQSAPIVPLPLLRAECDSIESLICSNCLFSPQFLSENRFTLFGNFLGFMVCTLPA